MLEARDLTYAIGSARLVDGVSLSAYGGEVLSIVGPNGAGKSTLLRLLSGELQPVRGKVYLHGQGLSEMNARETALKRAVLPQQTLLQFAFSSRDVVLMGRNPHLNGGWPGREDFAIADAALHETEMTEYAERKYPSLSGGEQSRVTLSRVLAQQAPVLLLDEPTSSLDVRHQEMVMSVAQSLALKGACVVVIIHDLNLAAAYSHRIALMRAGRVVACGPTGDVLSEELLSDIFECPIRVIPDGCQRLIVPQRNGRDALSRPERAEQVL
jgi:iron complex transport system ATP-binding protein